MSIFKIDKLRSVEVRIFLAGSREAWPTLYRAFHLMLEILLRVPGHTKNRSVPSLARSLFMNTLKIESMIQGNEHRRINECSTRSTPRRRESGCDEEERGWP